MTSKKNLETATEQVQIHNAWQVVPEIEKKNYETEKANSQYFVENLHESQIGTHYWTG